MENMLEGKIWNKILWFALPLAASSMLQQLFNSADIAVVGQFAGKEALAAVGSNGPIISLMINLFVGLSVGTNVLVARYLGMDKPNDVKKAVSTSIALALVSGLILIAVGFFLSRILLELMATPSDVIDLASVYLRIYFLGMPFIMFYNFSAAILRSVGDTKRPLLALIVAGVVNVILNLIFVIIFKLSVVGVGMATVISNIISSCLMLYFLTHEDRCIKLDLKSIRFHKEYVIQVIKIGLPAGIQSSVFSLANVVIQSSINTFGSYAIAGSAAAVNFEYFSFFLVSAFAQATVTFSSQNYGAGNIERCKKIVRISTIMAVVSAIILNSIVLAFDHQVLSLYTSDEKVIMYGIERLKWVLTIHFMNALDENFASGIRSLGYSTIPAIISIVGICGLRLVWISTYFASHRTLANLYVVYPISWIVTATSLYIAYRYVLKKVTNKKLIEE